MNMPTRLKHFCIYEYFLDGQFFQWEQVNEHYLPIEGETRELQAKDGRIIPVKVMGTEQISESEYRILLVSAH
jgi:hypothetical protein